MTKSRGEAQATTKSKNESGVRAPLNTVRAPAPSGEHEVSLDASSELRLDDVRPAVPADRGEEDGDVFPLEPFSLRPEEAPTSTRARALHPADDDLDPTPVPSSRPTAVPVFALEALTASGVRGQSASPLDLAVPVRTAAPAGPLSVRAAFLLLHVDGRSTIAQIATLADVALGDTIAAFIELVSVGLVLLDGSAGSSAPPSGVGRVAGRPA